MEKIIPGNKLLARNSFPVPRADHRIFHTSYDTALVFHLVSKIKARENHIAEHYISPELLEVLRSEDYPDLYITEYSSLLYVLRSAIAESLREPDLPWIRTNETYRTN